MAVEQSLVRYLVWGIPYESVGWPFTIPYEQIVSYEYREEGAHRLGILPSIAAGFLEPRQHRQVVTMVSLCGQLTEQFAVFEVPESSAGA